MLERGLLVITLVAGAAVGIFWPTNKQPAPSAKSGVEVTLERSSDKHFYATANVNGRDVRFLIDTGASEIALTEADAPQAGIKFARSRDELRGEGASGFVRGKYVTLDNIQLEGLHQDSAKAVVVEGANVSLLGQPFLENIDEIVIRQGEVGLRDQG